VDPTDTTVVIEPKLEGGVLRDGFTCKDRVRKIKFLGTFVEGFLQPIAAFLYYFPCVLLPSEHARRLLLLSCARLRPLSNHPLLLPQSGGRSRSQG
jgi:hypothetical protein